MVPRSRDAESGSRSRNETIELDPASTLVVVVDPQAGFSSPAGTFGKVFGLDELAPLRSAIARLNDFAAGLPVEVQVVVVLSEYNRGARAAGGASDPLSDLCTAGGPDCEIAEELVVQERWQVVTKHSTDAWASPEFREVVLRFLDRRGRHVVVVGLTATTCVRQSVLSILGAVDQGQVRIVLLRDLIGARASSFVPVGGEPSLIDRVYQEMTAKGAVCVESWKALRWRRPP